MTINIDKDQITCSDSDYSILKDFFGEMGVQLRQTTRGGGEVTFQAQNLYKSALFFCRDDEQKRVEDKIAVAKWKY